MNIIAAPPGRLSLGPKVTRVFDCMSAGEGTGRETPTNREGHTFYACELTQTAVPTKSQSCSAGSQACWTTFRTHERSGGGMWLGVEAETEGVVKREGV